MLRSAPDFHYALARADHVQRFALESTVRYLGVEVDDALALSEQVDL